jgi:hypothetical protein
MKTKRLGESAMMMRMVLVSLVAALGVTLPTPTQCSQWWLTVQNTGSAALADWDHWKPDDQRGYLKLHHLPPVIADEPAKSQSVRNEENAAALAMRMAFDPRASVFPIIVADHRKFQEPEELATVAADDEWPDLPLNVFQTPPVVFEPLDIADDLYNGVAYDLNRMADGVGIKVLAAVGTKSASRPTRPLAESPRPAANIERNLAPASTTLAACSRIDNLEAGLWAGLLQSAEHTITPEGSTSAATHLLGETRSDSEIKDSDQRVPKLIPRSAPPAATQKLSAIPKIASEVTQAIRLTNEAINAWMALLGARSSFEVTKR